MATWRQLRRSIARAQGTLPYNNRGKRRRDIFHSRGMQKRMEGKVSKKEKNSSVFQ